MPIVGTLLRLSDGRPDTGSPSGLDGPCQYLIVNRETASQRCADYVQKLPLDRIASDHQRRLVSLEPPGETLRRLRPRYVLQRADRMTIGPESPQVRKLRGIEAWRSRARACGRSAVRCLQRRRLVEPARTASRGEHDHLRSADRVRAPARLASHRGASTAAHRAWRAGARSCERADVLSCATRHCADRYRGIGRAGLPPRRYALAARRIAVVRRDDQRRR